MKFISKRTLLIIFLLEIGRLTMMYPISYWYGYYEMPNILFFLQLFFQLAGFMLFPILGIFCVIFIIQKKAFPWTMGILLGILTLILLKVTMPNPNNLIMYGMRDRILHDYSLGTLRQFANDFDQLPRLPNNLPVLAKIYMNKDLNNTGLKEKYPFLNWLKSSGGFTGPTFVKESDGVLYASWGGRPDWGFKVSTTGMKINPAEKSDVHISKVSDDIYFIIEYN